MSSDTSPEHSQIKAWADAYLCSPEGKAEIEKLAREMMGQDIRAVDSAGPAPIVLKPRRIKRYSLDIDSLARVFAGLPGRMHPHYRFDGIPEDARVVGVQIETGFLDRLYIYVWSDTFPPVGEGEVPPDAGVTITTWRCPEFEKLRDSY